jgi:Lon protease-like protein
MTIPLHIFEQRYRLMIEQCLASNSPFGIVLITHGSDVDDGSGPPTICRIGCLARIVRSEELADGRFFVEVSGDKRFEIEETSDSEPYLTGKITTIDDADAYDEQLEPLYESVSNRFRIYVKRLMERLNRTVSVIQLPTDPSALSFAVAGALDIPTVDKQALLEVPTTGARLQMEVAILDSSPSPTSLESVEPIEPPTQKPKSPLTDKAKVTPLTAADMKDKLSRN